MKKYAIGMGRVIDDGIYFTIVNVIVKQEYQARKVGSFIMHTILDYLANQMMEGSRASIQLISEMGKKIFSICSEVAINIYCLWRKNMIQWQKCHCEVISNAFLLRNYEGTE